MLKRDRWTVVLAVCVAGGALAFLPGCGMSRPIPPVPKDQRKVVEKALDVSQVVSVDDELAALRTKVAANPESTSAAAAQFRIGVLNEKRVKGSEGTGDVEGALSAYRAVMQNHGKSPFAPVAAYRLAELLGDSTDPEKRKEAVRAYEGVLGMMSRRSMKGDAKHPRPTPTVPVESDEGAVEWVKAHDLIPPKLDVLYQDRVSYQILSALVAVSSQVSKNGAHGLAIILLTIVVKLLLTPLTRKQFQSMKDMQKVQPEVKKLQEKLKDNPQKLNQEVMALYKRHGVNPLGGCFPLVIQMPILIWLYRAIMAFRLHFEGHGFLWVKDLSEPDMPLLVLYVISMIVSQKLTTMPTADPQQQQTQKMMAYMMPLMFAFMFQTFPSAFILYWLMFNVVSTIQQYYIMRGQAEDGEGPLGIKTLIPSLSKSPKEKEGPVVNAPRDLSKPGDQAGKKKRRKGRRKKK